MAVDFFKHSAFVFQSFIQWRWFYRTTIKTVEVRVGDFMPQAVVFFCFDHLPWLIGVVAEASWVIVPHGYISCTVHHPACQFTSQARAPANSDLSATATPVITYFRCRTNQRVAIWRMRYSTMYIALNTQLCEYWHPLHGVFKPRHDPIIIRLKQFVFSFPRAVFFPH